MLFLFVEQKLFWQKISLKLWVFSILSKVKRVVQYLHYTTRCWWVRCETLVPGISTQPFCQPSCPLIVRCILRLNVEPNWKRSLQNKGLVHLHQTRFCAACESRINFSSGTKLNMYTSPLKTSRNIFKNSGFEKDFCFVGKMAFTHKWVLLSPSACRIFVASLVRPTNFVEV